MIEEWRPLLGREGTHEVSSLGRVRRVSGRILKLHARRDRYVVVDCCVARTGHRCVYVHRAVVEAFVRTMMPGEQVNHIDGNKGNNTTKNLEIVSAAENMAHAARLGLLSSGERHYSRSAPNRVARGERVCGSKLTADQVVAIRARGESGETFASIGRDFGIAYQNVARVVRRQAWSHIDG